MRKKAFAKNIINHSRYYINTYIIIYICIYVKGIHINILYTSYYIFRMCMYIYFPPSNTYVLRQSDFGIVSNYGSMEYANFTFVGYLDP